MAAAATGIYSQACGVNVGSCSKRGSTISSESLQSKTFKVFKAERSGRGRSGPSPNLVLSFGLKDRKDCAGNVKTNQPTGRFQSVLKRHSKCPLTVLKQSAFLSGGAKPNTGGAQNGVGLRAGHGANFLLPGGASCHGGGGGCLKAAHKGQLFKSGQYSLSRTTYSFEVSCNAGKTPEEALSCLEEDNGTIESATKHLQESSEEERSSLQNDSIGTDEWQQEQAKWAVSKLLQREGVQKVQADKIALLAPLFCSSLVQKVSEMDGPPDTWAEMGLPDRPIYVDTKSASEESALEDELAAAFADAYRKPGDLPVPQEKRETEQRKLCDKSPPKPKLDFKKRKELQRRRKRRRPEEDDELEELLGINMPRGEPYRLAQWEAEKFAANGGVGELSIDEGREAGKRSSNQEEGSEENKGRMSDKVDKNVDGASSAGGVNDGAVSSLIDLERASLEDEQKMVPERAVEESSSHHETTPARDEERSSASTEECQESRESTESRSLSESERIAESSPRLGDASPSKSAEPSAKELYLWKLQWCADDSRGGGLLAPFFESLGIPPNEVKRLVRVFRRPQVRQRNGKLPIAEMVKRVENFEKLLRVADGLDAAKRLLDRSKDEALGKMKEDDDVERNVRYLEAAVCAQQEQTLKAAARGGVAGHESGNSGVIVERSNASKLQNVSEPKSESQESFNSTRSSAQFKKGIPEGIGSESDQEAAVPFLENGQSRSAEVLSKGLLENQQTNIASPSSSAEPKSGRDQPSSSPPATNEVLNQRLTATEPKARNPDTPPQNLVTKETKSLTQPPPWSAGLIVASFPELLFPQIETRNFEAMVAYLQREVGMTSAEAASVLLLFPPAFALDVETELKPRMRDLKSILRISWPDVARMIQRWPFVLSEMASASAIPTVDFLYREALVGIDAVGRVVAGLPHILFADVDKLLRPSLQFLLNHGVQHKRAHIGMMVSKCPQALLKGPARLSAVLEFLDCDANVYVSRIERVLLTCPELLGTRLEIAREKLDFLYDLGLTEGQLGRVVTWKPRVLLTSIQGLQQRVSFFEGLGFARTEVARMVHQFPDLLTYSVDRNFRPKVDYLVKDMGRSVNDLVDFPRFFSFSLDTRIRPRHESARAAGTFHWLVSISSLLTPNDAHFREAFLEGPSDAPVDNNQVEAGFRRQSRRSSKAKRSPKNVQDVEATLAADWQSES